MSGRLDLPLTPRRIAALPRDDRGRAVPWFAGRTADGRPDYAAVDPAKLPMAFRQSKCWICGQPLGRNVTFVLGPRAALTGVSPEPPSHLECAGYAVVACPFFASPELRRPADGAQEADYAGLAVLWTTRMYQMYPHGRGHLFDVGDPVACAWYRAARPATLTEVAGAISATTRALGPEAEKAGRDAIADLLERVQRLLPHMPAAAEGEVTEG